MNYLFNKGFLGMVMKEINSLFKKEIVKVIDKSCDRGI